MIVPMKKVSIIVQSKDADSAVGGLSSLGIVHVEHQKLPKGEDISRLRDDLELINSAIRVISEAEFLEQNINQQEEIPEDWRFVAKHIVGLRKRLEQLKEYSGTLKARIASWQRWGDFDPEEIEKLRQKGIYIRLYEIPAKQLKDLPQGVIVKEIFTSAGVAHCAVISRDKSDINLREVPLPKLGLEKMRTRLYEDGRMIELIQDDICKYLTYVKGLERVKRQLGGKLGLSEAINGMADSDSIVYLRGYIPFDKENILQEAAQKQNWGVVIEEPSEEDRVPTLTRNPRWVSIINPVFKIMEVVPGYREFDISLCFLIFLSIFFGIIIGDAAYGLIYLLLTLYFQHKFSRKIKNKAPFYLAYLFSFCAIAWGLMTASFFGQEWLASRSIKPLVPFLADDKNLRNLCFLIGAVHLSIAHIWRILMYFPALIFLADLGWILILWSAFLLARLLVLGIDFPGFGMWLLIPGIVLVALFSNPRKNPLRAVAAGLGTLALNLMNNFTDIVSYIRLFAVGLAGAALADAFNKMAVDIGIKGILGFVFSGLIIIAGHGLNIILGPMSVLVHGVRLNVLEFCSHLDVKWSGFEYRPLQENTA